MSEDAVEAPDDRIGRPLDERAGVLARLGYWAVLGLTVAAYAFCAAQGTADPSAVAFLIQLVAVAVTLRVAQVPRIAERAGWIVLAVAAIAALGVAVTGTSGRVLDIVLSGASLLAFLAAPIAIIAHQARRARVDTQALLAAICAYAMVGMFFTFVYNLIALVTSTPTFGAGEVDSLSSQLFFSFTTLTTTGYGNTVPIAAGVQSVAVTEAITGEFFLVVAVARILSGRLRSAAP